MAAVPVGIGNTRAVGMFEKLSHPLGERLGPLIASVPKSTAHVGLADRSQDFRCDTYRIVAAKLYR